MAPYQYRPLDEAKGELRLLRLQPASWGEDVKLHIQHVPLCESQRIGVMPSALTRVQATLPPGWTVYETLEGRCLFENTDGDYCSWIHPDDSIQDTITLASRPKSTSSMHSRHFPILGETTSKPRQYILSMLTLELPGISLFVRTLQRRCSTSALQTGKEHFG
jgi:hypothetical protein